MLHACAAQLRPPFLGFPRCACQPRAEACECTVSITLSTADIYRGGGCWFETPGSGKEKAHKRKQFFRWLPGWGGFSRPVAQGSNVYVLRTQTFPSGYPTRRTGDRGDRVLQGPRAAATTSLHFSKCTRPCIQSVKALCLILRVATPSGAPRQAPLDGVTETLFICQMFMCLFWPVLSLCSTRPSRSVLLCPSWDLPFF